jgi:hypothetical protein
VISLARRSRAGARSAQPAVRSPAWARPGWRRPALRAPIRSASTKTSPHPGPRNTPPASRTSSRCARRSRTDEPEPAPRQHRAEHVPPAQVLPVAHPETTPPDAAHSPCPTRPSAPRPTGGSCGANRHNLPPGPPQQSLGRDPTRCLVRSRGHQLDHPAVVGPAARHATTRLVPLDHSLHGLRCGAADRRTHERAVAGQPKLADQQTPPRDTKREPVHRFSRRASVGAGDSWLPCVELRSLPA